MTVSSLRAKIKQPMCQGGSDKYLASLITTEIYLLTRTVWKSLVRGWQSQLGGLVAWSTDTLADKNLRSGHFQCCFHRSSHSMCKSVNLCFPIVEASGAAKR